MSSEPQIAVEMREWSGYRAKVLLRGGQIEEFEIAGRPFDASVHNDKIDFMKPNGSVASFRWSEVVFIDYIPCGSTWVRGQLPKTIAETLIRDGNARRPVGE